MMPLLVFAEDSKAKIMQEINQLPANTQKNTYERILKSFVKAGGDIKEIKECILNATNNGNFEIIPAVESIMLPSHEDLNSLVDYYINTGASIGAFCKKPSKAIEYIKKGIELAEKNNLNKKLFRSLNGQLNHAWCNIAVNYERLNDSKNAASAYLKAAREIKKYYPTNTKIRDEFFGYSSYMMYKYLIDTYTGKDVFEECLPYLMEYTDTGNLKGLSALWNYFIDTHETEGLKYVCYNIIPKEKDPKAIADFYWTAAERFQHNELFLDAIFYHLLLIYHSKINNFKEYLFIDIDGIKHSRFEYVAYCFDKIEEDENSVQSILNALSEVRSEFGNDSKEFSYYSNYLNFVMNNPVKGPILQKILDKIK